MMAPFYHDSPVLYRVKKPHPAHSSWTVFRLSALRRIMEAVIPFLAVKTVFTTTAIHGTLYLRFGAVEH